MKIDDILGKIIALSKETYIQEPGCGFALKNQFLAGPGMSNNPFAGRLGLEWYYTQSAIRICEDLADMVTAYDPLLKNGNKETFCLIIRQTLEDNALNKSLFDGDSISLSRVNTLFKARIISDVVKFAKKLWYLIHGALLKTLTDWLLLYPLHRVFSVSVVLGFDGLSILKADDGKFWAEISVNYPDSKYWDPRTGERSDKKGYSLLGGPPPTWLAIEVNGTELGARISAERTMRTFLSVLFSHLVETEHNLFSKSMAQPISYVAQFPSEPSKVKFGQINAHIGRLLHPLLTDVQISSERISEVMEWYKLNSAAGGEKSHRAEVGSHFVNYGMIADDELQQFIQFFIALDALFGVRGKVENSIKEGVSKVFSSDTKWADRAELFFDLRSELVHGGSSSIDDWKNLAHYLKHFKSDPLDDIRLCSMVALRSYFTI